MLKGKQLFQKQRKKWLNHRENKIKVVSKINKKMHRKNWSKLQLHGKKLKVTKKVKLKLNWSTQVQHSSLIMFVGGRISPPSTMMVVQVDVS